MPAAYGDDLRERIVKAVREGATTREVSEVYEVAPSTVVKLHQRWRESGAVSAKPMGGDQRSHGIEVHKDKIMGLIAKRPDLTLSEVCAALASKGIQASRSALWRFFDRHGMRFKNQPRTPANRVTSKRDGQLRPNEPVTPK